VSDKGLSVQSSTVDFETGCVFLFRFQLTPAELSEQLLFVFLELGLDFHIDNLAGLERDEFLGL